MGARFGCGGFLRKRLRLEGSVLVRARLRGRGTNIGRNIFYMGNRAIPELVIPFVQLFRFVLGVLVRQWTRNAHHRLRSSSCSPFRYYATQDTCDVENLLQEETRDRNLTKQNE